MSQKMLLFRQSANYQFPTCSSKTHFLDNFVFTLSIAGPQNSSLSSIHKSNNKATQTLFSY